MQPEGDDEQECGEAGTLELLEAVKVVATEDATLITDEHVPSAPDTRKEEGDSDKPVAL